jgi:hypothetical protein
MSKFNPGDVIIGLPSSDFEYQKTNSHTLLKVEYIPLLVDADKEVIKNKMFVSIIMFEDHEPTGEEKKTHYPVDSTFFRLATKADRARFLISQLVSSDRQRRMNSKYGVLFG